MMVQKEGTTILKITLITVSMAISLSIGSGEDHKMPDFTVRLVSPRPGLLFTDSEPVDVRVAVTGAAGETVVDYAVEESAGPWRDAGKLTLSPLEKGAGEKPLPLRLPGRGLYRLSLSGTSGMAQAKAESWVAVVFTPRAPDAGSPWGIFYTPHLWFDKANPNGAADAALSHRLLGASWSRLNFWAHSFGEVTISAGEKLEVTADYSLWKSYAKALKDQGILIMGEIAQCPRELSSRPNETAQVGDAGPVYNRVKPNDYALWDQLMEKLAADFRQEIQVWEVWNEANLENRYWTGTVEDFFELVKHTSQALKRGNPNALIAAAGFVGGLDFADKLFQLGLGQHIDILSVHYTDDNPGIIVQWQNLLRKHNLHLPIWNSEEKSEIPLRNLASPIERSFKFIHVLIGYPEYRPLVRKDWTVLPAGIAFSVGAHCIGTARPIGRNDKIPGWEAFFFRRVDEVIGVFQSVGLPMLFGGNLEILLEAEPLDAEKPPTITDVWGRSRPLWIEKGEASLALNGSYLFVNGCRKLEILRVSTGLPADTLVFEAESGRMSKGWGANPKGNFSGERIAEIWTDQEPDAEGYWVEIVMNIPTDGRYEVIFSGNGLNRLKTPRSISPFVWSIDEREAHELNDAVPVLAEVRGIGEPPAMLGVVNLKSGQHTFRLKLKARRDEPDKHYALWFDAIALRPAK